MKKLYFMLLAVSVLVSASTASELSKAYKQEYAFLKAQKAELASRFIKGEAQHKVALEEVKVKVDTLQQKLLLLDKKSKEENTKLEKLTEELNNATDNGSMLGNVLNQARVALGEYNVKIPEGNRTKDSIKLQDAFTKTSALYKQLSTLQNTKGSFYLPDGTLVKGEVVKLGNIAAYGISKNATGALAPAGNGTYKLWSAVGSSDDAKALFAGEIKDSIDIFVYENLDKDIKYVKEKTVEETIASGGTIGYIILALGVFGFLLLIFRVFSLLSAVSNVSNISSIVVSKVEEGKSDEALEAIKGFKGSTARVIKSLLRNINKDREHVEDIVMESILNESSQIDRFGSFVLVIAAVSPLLGLLGTVTGMIETFDVITEFGTGDPKLLSGGISAALVTTMLGLIVAIPLLLLGNLLSGWAQSIKDSMEQNALHIVNIYEKYRG